MNLKNSNEDETKMKEVKEFIEQNDNFLITTHVNADGDAYASSLAVAQLLKKLGKKYTILYPDSIKEKRYSFLPLYDEILPFEENKNYGPFDTAIITDAPGEKRLPGVLKFLPPKEKRVKIDHHPAENELAKFTIENTKVSSASHLVYKLIMLFNDILDYNLALTLYAGISYDTGRFSFSNTASEDYQIAAHLMQFGIKIHEINEEMFFNYNLTALKVIGYGLSNFQVMENGQVGVIHIPLNLVEQVKPGDIDELAHYAVSVEGVRIGLFIREIKPNFYKVSLRARDDTPVNEIARYFDGGGHRKAAGCRITGNYDEVVHQLLNVIKKFWSSK